MGQKDKKQPVSHKLEQELRKRGQFHSGDVRGYARMRKAMLEREKRSAAEAQDSDHSASDEAAHERN